MGSSVTGWWRSADFHVRGVIAPICSSSTTTRSDLISRFINDANLLRYSMAKALTGLVKDSLLVIFLSMILIFHNWSLALLTVLCSRWRFIRSFG